MECIICKNGLVGKQRYFCSKRCRQKHSMSKPKQKERVRKYMKEYQKRNKAKSNLRVAHHRQIDKKQCYFCGYKHNLQQHHTKYVDNLECVFVLCVSCHKKFHYLKHFQTIR